MAVLKVTKRFKYKNKPLSSLFRFLIKIILPISFILLTNPLYADEQANKNFQFAGVLLVDSGLFYTQEDDIGYDPDKKRNIYTRDEESARLIFSGRVNAELSWEAQYFNERQASILPVTSAPVDTSLFRIKNGRYYFVEDYKGDNRTNWYHEIDRLSAKYEYGNYSTVVGRQAITWGSGRFWQPTDVFGAFSPLELNREYKPGIDAIKFNFFPNFESGLTLAYVFGNRDEKDFEDSAALNYRTTLGQASEVTLLAGKIVGAVTGGGSIETSWLGIGWRLESILFKEPEKEKPDNFSIAGLDYQFSNGLIIGLEYYYNTLGANKESELLESASQATFINGQQKHLGQNIVGFAFSKNLTPLLTGNYNLLGARLEDTDANTSWSTLHQFFFNYSIADEADALLAFHYGTGKGLDNFGLPRSEFGHVPATVNLRLRYYF